MADDLEQMLVAYWRGERAIAAGRRYLSRNRHRVVSLTDVCEFLRRRRDRLSEADIDDCAREAIQRSPANRWTPRRQRRLDQARL